MRWHRNKRNGKKNGKKEDGECKIFSFMRRGLLTVIILLMGIVGATATCHFRSIQEGLFAITNDIYGAVRARPNARYLPPEIDKVKGTGKVLHFWPTADGQQWIELTTQFVMTKQGTMSINSLIHIQGDKLNTTLVH